MEFNIHKAPSNSIHTENQTAQIMNQPSNVFQSQTPHTSTPDNIPTNNNPQITQGRKPTNNTKKLNILQLI